MEVVKIVLTIEERDLILNNSFVEEALISRLRTIKPKENEIEVEYLCKELDHLVYSIALEAGQTRDKELEDKLDELCMWLDRIYGKSQAPRLPGSADIVPDEPEDPVDNPINNI